MDVRMTGISGIDAMREIRSYNPAIPVLIMTAYSAVNIAVQALKAGACDYLTKPLDFEELKISIERALDHVVLREENYQLKTALAEHFDVQSLVCRSRAMHSLIEMLKTVAPSEATVLITGESGIGKERIAKILHANSARRTKPFVAVNCAALSENLLESELFGHEKGAFTGADRQRDGLFLAADKGTLLLDEVGEIPLPMQAKLLRALQEREIQRVGGDKPLKINVRILAATNRDLKKRGGSGTIPGRSLLSLACGRPGFAAAARADRGYSPSRHPVFAAICEKNGKLIKGFTPGAMDRLLKYQWPGNVRELENTVERAVVLLLGQYISERELPPGIHDAESQAAGVDFTDKTLEEIERIVVREAVEQCGGNKSEAARRLGITRKTLLSKLQKYHI